MGKHLTFFMQVLQGLYLEENSAKKLKIKEENDKEYSSEKFQRKQLKKK